MPKTALIIEDDESQAKALQALCQKLGLEASFARNGKEGFEQAAANPPDLLLLDLLVPGMDGFKIADGLKSKGVAPAILVVSGVYKDPKVAKEFADRYAADFFQKPYKADDLSACITRRLRLASTTGSMPAIPKRASGEAPAVLPPMDGSLRDKPFHALLLELSRGKASGTLELTQGQVKKRIFLHFGQVRFAQSNVKAENVGGMQVAEGTLSDDRFKAAVVKARDERIGIGEALAVAGVISYDELAKATRRQVEEVVVTAFNWTDGRYTYVSGATDKIQDSRHDPIALLLTAHKRYLNGDKARALLAPLAKGTISRGPDFDRLLFTLRSVFPGESLTPTINGRLTVAEVAAKAKPDELPLLAAVVQMGLAVVSGVEIAKKAVARPSAPSRRLNAEEEAAAETIGQEHARVMAAKDLFAVLRLQRGASVEECKASYLQLAKRFHADSYAGLELGEATEKLREMFARISEANSTLTDPKRRADYQVLLERQDAGLPTDMEVIFKAEAAFNRGDALIKQGRFSDAEAALKEALKLDGSVAQYHVALAQAVLKGHGASGLSEALQILDKALQINPEHVAAKLLKADVLEQQGDPRAALKLVDEVLGADPSNMAADSQHRAIRERHRKGKESNKGLLGKLFKK